MPYSSALLQAPRWFRSFVRACAREPTCVIGLDVVSCEWCFNKCAIVWTGLSGLAQISSLWTRGQYFSMMLATRPQPIVIPYHFFDYAALLEFTLVERRSNFLSSSVSQASRYVPVCNGLASGRVDFQRDLIHKKHKKKCRTREQLHLIGSCRCASPLSLFASFTCSPSVGHFSWRTICLLYHHIWLLVPPSDVVEGLPNRGATAADSGWTVPIV